MIEAKVIAKSVAPNGQVITTFQATHHRYILSELNTHRVFSRNSASSRAIPVEKQVKKVLENPAMPLYYAYNQAGMQAFSPMTISDETACRDIILELRDHAAEAARKLANVGPLVDGKPSGLHKQWANRYLEPWMWHTVIITSTEWDNFYKQRKSALAMPEINDLAIAMYYADSKAAAKPLDYGEWHLPYITDEDRVYFPLEVLLKISAARCARVSYLTQEGTRDVYADLKLWERLTTSQPPHWSPLEHVATPFKPRKIRRWIKPLGNFDHWAQLRHNVYNGGLYISGIDNKKKLT